MIFYQKPPELNSPIKRFLYFIGSLIATACIAISTAWIVNLLAPDWIVNPFKYFPQFFPIILVAVLSLLWFVFIHLAFIFLLCYTIPILIHAIYPLSNNAYLLLRNILTNARNIITNFFQLFCILYIALLTYENINSIIALPYPWLITIVVSISLIIASFVYAWYKNIGNTVHLLKKK